jgi:hypothetical protein
MTVQEVKAVAKTRGMKFGNMTKEKIIRAIQRDEGNTDCFAKSKAKECGQENCLWRQDCLKVIQ